MELERGRILVPVSGDAVDKEAIGLACDIAKRSKSKVYAIYVIKVKRSLPIDADLEVEAKKGDEVLKQVEETAALEECEIETGLIQAREVGPAIVDEVLELKADLVVMGMSYRKRFGEFSLGDTIPYVLRNTPCPVLLFREPAPIPESLAKKKSGEG